MWVGTRRRAGRAAFLILLDLTSKTHYGGLSPGAAAAPNLGNGRGILANFLFQTSALGRRDPRAERTVTL